MSTLLPLTRFEQYIHHMHCPSHPWIVHTRLIFEGDIELSLLTEAVTIALRKHPLLSSRIVKKNGRLFWSIIDEPAPRVELLDSQDIERYPDFAPMDLETTAGLRVFLKKVGAQSIIYVQWHHLCGDGQGITFFLQDMMVAYHRVYRNEAIPEASFDFASLRDRDKWNGSFPERCLLGCRQVPGLLASATMLCRRFYPISSKPISSRDSAIKRPYTCERSLDPEFSRKLAIAARALGVTANDLMLRELFFTIGRWTKANGFNEDNAWFRIAIPVSLRSLNEYNQSVRNRLSIVVLQRRHKTMLQYARLLELISDEMRFVKSQSLAHTLPLMLRWASWFPGGIRSFTRTRVSAASTVFSNLGKVFKRCPLPKESGLLCMGPTQLIQFDGLTAISYPQSASVFVSQYAGRMNINMSYHPGALNDAQAAEIMDRFVSGLKAVAANPNRDPST